MRKAVYLSVLIVIISLVGFSLSHFIPQIKINTIVVYAQDDGVTGGDVGSDSISGSVTDESGNTTSFDSQGNVTGESGPGGGDFTGSTGGAPPDQSAQGPSELINGYVPGAVTIDLPDGRTLTITGATSGPLTGNASLTGSFVSGNAGFGGGTAVDTNNDGIIDGFDTNGDGTIDTGGSDTGAGEGGGGGDSGYVPPDTSGAPVQSLNSVSGEGCNSQYPLVRYNFTASYSPTTVKFEVWRQRRDLDNFTVVREVSAPGSYLDNRLDSNSYSATNVEYFIRRVDSGYGNLDTNHIQINVQNCTTPPATPPPPLGGGSTPPPLTGGESVTLNSALNSSCSGIYPQVSVNFSSNFNPPGGYQLWHHNNPYRDWQVFSAANTPGTYTDTMADSNWYQGVTTYMVRAVDASGGRLLDSNNIAVVTSNCNAPTAAQFIPPSPRAYCSGTEGRITLSWTIPQNFNVNNGDRYYIQRVDGADNRIEYGPTEANSFEDGSISIGQIYSYNIRAVTSAGATDSGWSSAASALNCGAPLTNLYINNSRAPLPVLSGTQAQISWDSQNATGCVGSSNPSQNGWDGARNASGERSTGALSRPPDRVSYTLSCTNINNGQADVKTVSVDIRTPSSCIKTTGGDVHSNEGIAGPADCP